MMTTEYQVARLTEVLNETMFPTVRPRFRLSRLGSSVCADQNAPSFLCVLACGSQFQTAQREQLAEELGMTPRRIQVWFQVSYRPLYLIQTSRL